MIADGVGARKGNQPFQLLELQGMPAFGNLNQSIHLMIGGKIFVDILRIKFHIKNLSGNSIFIIL